VRNVPVTEFIQVLTTTPTKAMAETIADALVQERVAACVQVLGPISSVYSWKGQVERAQEWLVFIKAKATDFQRVEQTIRTNHSHEVPEIIALPVQAGGEDYLEWLRASLSSSA
jgi:periplasmic divalent cation tolerance protein